MTPRTSRTLTAALIGAAALTALSACTAVPAQAPATSQIAASTQNAQDSKFPSEMSGKWCTHDAPSTCFDSSDFNAKYPNSFLEAIDKDKANPSARVYDICLEADLDNGCSMASTMLLEYLPKGVAWNCRTEAETNFGLNSCDPDYTEAHDTSQPRLVRLANHQQDAAYHDSPPMYRAN
jgi:hypothetical protein